MKCARDFQRSIPSSSDALLVVFRPEVLEQLEELYDVIAGAGAPDNAEGFTESIVSLCESLADFPYRGVPRNDLRPALRTIGYRKRVVIAYAALNKADLVDHVGDAPLSLLAEIDGGLRTSLNL